MIHLAYIVLVTYFFWQPLPERESLASNVRFGALVCAGVAGIPFSLIASWEAIDAPQNLLKTILALGQLVAFVACYHRLWLDKKQYS